MPCTHEQNLKISEMQVHDYFHYLFEDVIVMLMVVWHLNNHSVVVTGIHNAVNHAGSRLSTQTTAVSSVLFWLLTNTYSFTSQHAIFLRTMRHYGMVIKCKILYSDMLSLALNANKYVIMITVWVLCHEWRQQPCISVLCDLLLTVTA